MFGPDEDDELIAALRGRRAGGLEQDRIALGDAAGKGLVNRDHVVGVGPELERNILGEKAGVDAVIRAGQLLDDGALHLGFVHADEAGEVVGLENVVAGLDFHGVDQRSRVREPGRRRACGLGRHDLVEAHAADVVGGDAAALFRVVQRSG